jgi:hypothetical protein
MNIMLEGEKGEELESLPPLDSETWREDLARMIDEGRVRYITSLRSGSSTPLHSLEWVSSREVVIRFWFGENLETRRYYYEEIKRRLRIGEPLAKILTLHRPDIFSPKKGDVFRFLRDEVRVEVEEIQRPVNDAITGIQLNQGICRFKLSLKAENQDWLIMTALQADSIPNIPYPDNLEGLIKRQLVSYVCGGLGIPNVCIADGRAFCTLLYRGTVDQTLRPILMSLEALEEKEDSSDDELSPPLKW